MIETAPLQIYSSALIFSPRASKIRAEHQHHVGDFVQVLGPEAGRWNSCLQTLQGHLGSVHALTLSLDGKVVASESDDHTVKLWNIRTGECLKTFHASSFYRSVLTFSSAGQILAETNFNKQQWNIETGECQEFHQRLYKIWSPGLPEDRSSLIS